MCPPPSPAGAADLTVVLEPQRHLLVSDILVFHQLCVRAVDGGEDRVWSADDEFKLETER